jgi:hypothetical protein
MAKRMLEEPPLIVSTLGIGYLAWVRFLNVNHAVGVDNGE